MPQKRVDVPGIGEVLLIKRRGARAIRVTITGDSLIRVSLPSWVPYQAGAAFVEAKKSWIEAHVKPRVLLKDGQLIGKSHRLVFTAGEVLTTKTRVTPTEIRVTYPQDTSVNTTLVQEATKKAALRALKQEGEALLPRRLHELAAKHGFTFRSASLKRLKARWGSCTHQQDIVLNIFLMQLPWQLIDYVLVHELVHTEVLHHGEAFWERFARCTPKPKTLRKELKNYHPYF